MGKYLDILKQAGLYDKNDIDDKSPTTKTTKGGFGRINRFCRTFTALEARCPDHVPIDRWQECIEDGRRFLGTWGAQAESLGWTSADLFGLHTPPERPHPSYRRLSRYDATGLVWLLDGRPVVAPDGRHGRNRESHRQHHRLSQAQQARTRAAGR
jgi:hypothetical protein